MAARLSRPRPSAVRRRDVLPALLLLPLLGNLQAPPPASAQGAGPDTLTLLWSAPGDDGALGTANRYEVRMSTAPIDDGNWSDALLIGGAPAPLPSGARQRMVVRGLSRDTTYYFAIKAVDDADNMAPLSNVVRWDWILDTAPPAAPAGITAGLEADDVRVRWSANAEPDLSGYTVYRAESASGPFVALNSSLLSSTDFLDTTIPAEATQVWYQVTATDASGNESARSAVASLSLVEASGVFTLYPVYPNPSHVSEPVNIPVEIPSTGPGGAELQIVEAGRRVVRVLSLAGLPPGRNVVVWDGLNEGGYGVAPGVYRVWLMGTDDDHLRVKLVRLP